MIIFYVLTHDDDLFVVSVLPSFSGNIPAALKKIYPSANIKRLGNWYYNYFID